jgi:predicted NBD/HSP70 family sugar kinase
VINGALVAGARGVAGEIGHMPVAADGPDCHCGGFGCVEAIASTKAIVIKAREVSGDHSLTIEQAADLARSGHTPLLRLFEDVGQAIGRALAGMANLTGPEKIIVSGEGLAAYDLLQESIRSAFVRQAFGATAYCPLILRPLPFEEWARGAAAVAVQELVTLTDGQPLV